MFAQHIVRGLHRLQMEWGSQDLVAWAPIPLPCLVWSHQTAVIALCRPGWEERCRAEGWKHRWALFQEGERLWREQLLWECASHEFSCVHWAYSSLSLSRRGHMVPRLVYRMWPQKHGGGGPWNRSSSCDLQLHTSNKLNLDPLWSPVISGA